MNKEDYQEILEKMEKATGNEVFCDGGCVVNECMYKEIMKVISKQMFELSTSDEPVTPQQKIGKWLAKSFHEVYCDNCKFDFDIMTNEFIDKMKYCPNCGAKMEGDEIWSDK